MSKFDPERDLQIERLIPARAETIWRCWSEPELFKQWFTPAPVEVVEVQNDLHSGGRAYNVMKLPDGTLMHNDGCFLLVEPFSRLVFTDGCLAGFRPSADPAFMVADIHLKPESDGHTLYSAHVMHSSPEKRIEHEGFGFAEGWGTSLSQLADLVKTL